jgi:hypothetical protein
MTYTNDNHKRLFTKTLRTKWPYKKHTHASINKMYEMRGRVGRKIRIWTTETGYKTPALKQYSAYKRVVKRVTSGYSRRHTVK